MQASTHSLLVAAELNNLAEIRRFVQDAARRLGVEPGLLPKLCRAVDEAATNIILHGYQGQPGTIEIELQRAAGRLIIALRDKAPVFDPTCVPAPDLHLPLEQRAPGGFGVHLIRQAVDEMVHRASPQGGNELVLVKHLDGGDLQDSFTSAPEGPEAFSQERELARLRALNYLAQELNRSLDVRAALEATLESLVKVMGLKTAWISLVSDDVAGEPTFSLAAAYGLPPGLERDDRYYLRRPPACRCQSLLRAGQLPRAVNIVECSRLRDAGDTHGLLFHATVPIVSQGRALGLLNVAAGQGQIFSQADLQLLSAMGVQVAVALERARLYDVAHSQRTRLEHELEMARSAQASLLPASLPSIPGFDLAADWRSAYEVSGDFYDVFPLDAGRWGLVIADVSGKGAAAALYMVMARSLIRSAVEHHASPAHVLMQVNRALASQSSAQMFVTTFYAVLDPLERTLTYASAGHDPPVLKRASGQAGRLPRGGLFMGLFDEISLLDATISLAPGDVLVIYTDGLTETFDADHHMFGVERLAELVRSFPRPSSQQLVDAIVAEALAFAGGAPQADDMTLLVLTCRPPA